VAVLPDDVSGLGRLVELEGLAKNDLAAGVFEGERLDVLLNKDDEGRHWHCHRVEVLEELVHNLVLLAHLVEVLASDQATAFAQRVDQLLVVEGEADVRDLHIRAAFLCRFALKIRAVGSLLKRASLELHSELFFNLLRQVASQRQSWSDIVLEIAA
jgi:hypothetical protein